MNSQICGCEECVKAVVSQAEFLGVMKYILKAALLNFGKDIEDHIEHNCLDFVNPESGKVWKDRMAEATKILTESVHVVLKDFKYKDGTIPFQFAMLLLSSCLEGCTDFSIRESVRLLMQMKIAGMGQTTSKTVH